MWGPSPDGISGNQWDEKYLVFDPMSHTWENKWEGLPVRTKWNVPVGLRPPTPVGRSVTDSRKEESIHSTPTVVGVTSFDLGDGDSGTREGLP